MLHVETPEDVQALAAHGVAGKCIRIRQVDELEQPPKVACS